MIAALTKADAAYLELRSAILDGTLKPGSLLDQGAIAQRLGISTTPVREALRRLEAEYLVVAEAHRDAVVAFLSMDELHHLYTIRLALDPLAARLACQELTDGEIEDIERLARDVPGSTSDQVRINREFHRLIYTAPGNPILVQTLDSLWNRCDRYRFLLAQAPGELVADREGHDQLVMAFRKRDADLCAEVMHSHIKASYETLARLAEVHITESASLWLSYLAAAPGRRWPGPAR